MDIEQIRVARREMEDSIQAAVLEAMKAFHAKTGMYPQSIDVRPEAIVRRIDKWN